MAEQRPIKEIIMDTVADLVGAFLYYGRKEDEDLSSNVLQDVLKHGIITSDEIVAKFKEVLENNLKK